MQEMRIADWNFSGLYLDWKIVARVLVSKM